MIRLYLIYRWLKFRTKLDYRLTQQELLDLGASEKVMQDFYKWWDKREIKQDLKRLRRR